MRHPTTHGSYTVTLARDADDVRAAQQLRWRVFAEELGARLDARHPGIDADRWDPHAEHLLVRHAATGEVVGTYRLLTADAARAAGGFYAESEFWLAGLHGLGRGVAEVGRACVAPAHRTGAVVGLLWAGVVRWLDQRCCDHVIGCASVGLDAGLVPVRRLCRRLLLDHGAPIALRGEPRRPLPRAADDAGVPGTHEAPMPPLLRGYLRLGALVCGEPAWDPDFRTADLLLLLPLRELSRHASRLRRAA